MKNNVSISLLRIATILISTLLLNSCALPAVEYAPVPLKESSWIRVTSDFELVNTRVYVHEGDPADIKSAKIAGHLTNHKSPLIKKRNVEFFAPSGQEITISMPFQFVESYTMVPNISAEIGNYQPVFTFTPQPNCNYEIVFNKMTAKLYLLDTRAQDSKKSEIFIGRINPNFTLSTKNLGNDVKPFFIKNVIK